MNEKHEFKLPRWEEIPNIELYLDQVISLVDSYLSPMIRNDAGEPILTKTMVNNYVKHKIIDAPLKKKYSKNSVCCLIAICILKSVYSMNDISILIKSALGLNKPEETYNWFCTSIEVAVACAFDGKPFSDRNPDSQFPYLMQNVAQSFAGKLYTREYCFAQCRKPDGADSVATEGSDIAEDTVTSECGEVSADSTSSADSENQAES